MKTLLIIFLGLWLGPATCAQDRSDLYLTKTLSGETIKSIAALTPGGNISVENSDIPQSRVEVYVRSGNGRNLSKEEIAETLERNYDLEVSVSGSKLTAAARSEGIRNWVNSLSISFKIYVPGAVSGKLRTSGGNISLSALSGELDFATSGGNLYLNELTGVVNGETSGGNIEVSNSSDMLELRTSGGNIAVSNCGGEIALVTSGGSIRLERLEGSVNAATSGGNISGNQIEGELVARTSGGNIALDNISGSLDASTSGGQISANLLELGDYVKLQTSAGGISLGLPAGEGLNLDIRANHINAGSFENFKGSIEDDHIAGQLAGGGIPVELKAGSGNVRLNWQ